LEYQALTGLTAGQLGMLILLVRQETGDVVRPGGRPAAIGLAGSVKMVVALMRRNLVQEIAGEIFGCSQPTVSRRRDRLRPVIGKVLAGYVPDPVQVLGREGTVLVDGTICPVWDWSAIPDLYSGKAGYCGMNVQVAASLSGNVVAIGPHALHGARNDAVAFDMSGMKDLLEKARGEGNSGGDLGYIGVDGITIVPFRKPRGENLLDWQKQFNAVFSKIRAAVEHANATVKYWRMLSEEGGRYRCPITKYDSMLAAITGLLFFSQYYEELLNNPPGVTVTQAHLSSSVALRVPQILTATLGYGRKKLP
jgi:DDE superfamily endonuclease